MMVVSSGHNHKVVRHNGHEYHIMWDSLTIASPEGSTVIVSDLSRPQGQRQLWRIEGTDQELEALKQKAEEFVARL